MKNIVIVAALGAFALGSCAGEKKDVCTCMKEAAKIMIDKDFDVDPYNPEYSDGCDYLSEMNQEEIDKQLDDKCIEEIENMIFGDMDMNEMDFEMDDMNLEDFEDLEGELGPSTNE